MSVLSTVRMYLKRTERFTGKTDLYDLASSSSTAASLTSTACAAIRR